MDSRAEDPQIGEDEKDIELVKDRIRKLIATGFLELSTEQGSFILTARNVKIPNRADEYKTAQESFKNNDWESVNEILIIDLFERVVEDGKDVFRAVGWHDYRISRKSDGVVANGNRGSRLFELRSFEPKVVDEGLMMQRIPFQEIDKSPHLYGIQVENEHQKKGFGKLLTAVTIGSLKQLGVKTLDFSGKQSSEYSPILQELGFYPFNHLHEDHPIYDNPRQPITDFKDGKIAKMVKPFLRT